MAQLARALFWSVNEYPIYLLGTIHMGPVGGYRFTERTEALITSADLAYFEINPLKPDDMSFMYRPMNSATTLAEELGAHIYSYVEKTLSLKRPLKDHSAGGIMDLIEASISSPPASEYSQDFGVDRLICQHYLASRKEVRFLETAGDAGQAAISGPIEEIVTELKAWLDTGRVPRADGREVISAYESANLETLAQLRREAAPLRPTRTRAQFQGREALWVKKMEEIIDSKRSTLIAVGALHFPGPDGLLELVRKLGLTIDRLGML